MANPNPTIGQVHGQLPACILRMKRQVIEIPTPGCAGVAAFVQIVQMGEPAAVGALVFRFAAG